MNRTAVALEGGQHVDVVAGNLTKAERLVRCLLYRPSTSFLKQMIITWKISTAPWVWCIAGTQ